MPEAPKVTPVGSGLAAHPISPVVSRPGKTSCSSAGPFPNAGKRLAVVQDIFQMLETISQGCRAFSRRWKTSRSSAGQNFQPLPAKGFISHAGFK